MQRNRCLPKTVAGNMRAIRIEFVLETYKTASGREIRTDV